MIKFVNNQRGGIAVGKILVIAVIAIILLLIFKISVYVRCTSDKTIDKISIVVLNLTGGEGAQNCRDLADNKYAQATSPSNGSDTTGGTGGGTSGGGTGGSTGPGSSVGDGGGVIFTPPPEGYVPISYYDNADVSLSCADSNSYYQFQIPQNAPPTSTGTKTLTVKNKKGWDIWMKITKIDTLNGLQITSYETKYLYIANDSTANFDIKWKWNVASDYTGQKGAAAVYFKTVCTKPSDSEIFIAKPNKPSNFKVIDKTENSVELAWDNVENATSYRLYRNGAIIYTGSLRNYKDTGLWSGTNYNYTVKSYNAGGYSSGSDLSVKTLGVSPLPTMPQNLIVEAKTDTTVSLKWDAVSNATSYTIDYDGGYPTVTTNNYKVTGLLSGTNYGFWVRANNSYGSSGWAYVNATTTGESPVPGNPNNLVLTPTETTMKIKWDAVPKAQEYELMQNWTVVYKGPLTEFTTTGLEKGTMYYYQVRAVNGNYYSGWTYGQKKTLGESLYPTAPGNFRITNKTNITMDLKWNAVTNADYYILKKGDTEIYRGTATDFTVTGLSQNSYYYYYVQAVNSYGSSDSSYTSGYTTNVTYDDTTDISNQCQDKDLNNTFNIPSNAKPGEGGKFEITVTNSTNRTMSAQITNINKIGTLFEGPTPVTIEYDASAKMITANTQGKLEIIWKFPTNYQGDYAGKTGAISVYFSTKCQ